MPKVMGTSQVKGKGEVAGKCPYARKGGGVSRSMGWFALDEGF